MASFMHKDQNSSLSNSALNLVRSDIDYTVYSHIPSQRYTHSPKTPSHTPSLLSIYTHTHTQTPSQLHTHVQPQYNLY